ncbi:MAG: aminopeptidase C, partial [Chitinophagaceae bacterium]
SQVDLMNKVVNNQSDDSKAGFQFTTVVNAEATPIENQGNSGTCWSYSTNSFLESEMIRNGGPAIHLSPIYSARCAYMQKAIDYVRMHGSLCWDDGGEEHDVINMYAKYGTIPEADYTGLNYGTKENDFPEMMGVLKSMLDEIIKAPNQGTLTPNWKEAVTGVLNAYLGPVPKTFQYDGKTYTPESFAKDVVKLNPDNYVEFISQTNTPYWKKAPMMFPDNWEMQSDWNIPMDDISKIIDYALEHHYTIAWGTDVSEPYFSWKNGIAYVPAASVRDMTPEQRATMFDGPKPEMSITPEMRQEGIDNYQTTDDHGMQITGIAKDQNGKDWYIVKNSWGTHNDYKGFLYVTKDYVDYKTTSFMVNKNGIPESIREKLGI